MTSTSQTYFLIPTNTFTSGFSTPSNGPEGDSTSDLLSSTSSPPLIVAFLAIGLFVVAMIGVFAWRRVLLSRRMHHQFITTNLQPKPIPLGERPVLWDVWADPRVREQPSLGEIRWESITPMAAVSTFLVPTMGQPVARPPPIRPVGPGGYVPFRMLRCLMFAVRRFYLLGRPPLPPPPSAEPCEKEAASRAPQTPNETEWGDASSLQVSVIIAMPTQRNDGTPAAEDAEIGEFCIGTMDVPWSDWG